MTPEKMLAEYQAGKMSLAEVQEQLHTLTRLSGGHSSAAPIVSPAENEIYELAMLEEVWQPHRLCEDWTSGRELNNLVCFLSDNHQRQRIIEWAQTKNLYANIIFIAAGEEYGKQNASDYIVNAGVREHFIQALGEIKAEFGAIDALLYLWPFEEQQYLRNYACIIYLLQAVAASGVSPQCILFGSQYQNELEQCYPEAWIGFAHSLGQIMPDVAVAVVMLESGGEMSVRDKLAVIFLELYCSP
ncbi:MAG: hypothetical protein ACRCTT_19005, partial [Enterobacter roggenkampii]